MLSLILLLAIESDRRSIDIRYVSPVDLVAHVRELVAWPGDMAVEAQAMLGAALAAIGLEVRDGWR